MGPAREPHALRPCSPNNPTSSPGGSALAADAYAPPSTVPIHAATLAALHLAGGTATAPAAGRAARGIAGLLAAEGGVRAVALGGVVSDPAGRRPGHPGPPKLSREADRDARREGVRLCTLGMPTT